MTITRRSALGLAASGLAFSRRSRAAAKPIIRICVLTDLSGPYKDNTGEGAIACARQAIAEFSAQNDGFDVELLVRDQGVKSDVAIGLAREMYDRADVDLITDVPSSSVALGVAALAAEKNKVFIACSAATPDLTGKSCTPNTLSWVRDTYSLAKGTTQAVVQDGGQTWFYIAADYVFGQQLERDSRRFAEGAGGRVLGSVLVPLNTSDYSSALLLAQQSQASVIGLANSGDDTISCIKQAHEFGLTQNGTRLVGLLTTVQMVNTLGLETAQGLVMTETFYWNLNDRTRALSKRLEARRGKVPCGGTQVGNYSAIMHYLKTVATVGADVAKADGAAVVRAMKAMPVDDDAFGLTHIREDGRNLPQSHVFRAKTPAESAGGWDYLTLLRSLPGSEMAPPMAGSGCTMSRG